MEIQRADSLIERQVPKNVSVSTTPLAAPQGNPSFTPSSFERLARCTSTVRLLARPAVLPSSTARPRKVYSMRPGQGSNVFLENGRWKGRYRVDLPGEPKRQRKKVTLGLKSQMTKTEAKQKLKILLADQGIDTREYFERALKPLKPAITFNGIADHWEAKRLPMLKPSSRYTAPLLLKKYIRPYFGSMVIDSIKTGTINDWIADLSRKDLEPKTVHNLYKIFRAIANWHARQNDQPRRAWYPDLPLVPAHEQRWFSQDEVRSIVATASGQYRVFYHLAGFSGLRFGELCGLHVEDLDLDRGLVHVRRSVWRGTEVTTKNQKTRMVSIDTTTVNMLREHLGTRRCGRVFETRNGTPLNSKTVLHEKLYPICRQLGIPRGGCHAFRHGRVSHLQMNNAPTDFVKREIGHSSLRVTSGYTHFSDDFRRDLVNRLAN